MITFLGLTSCCSMKDFRSCFNIRSFFFFATDFVEVLFLGLVGGTVVMGSIILGMKVLVSCGSVTAFSSET